MDDRITQLCRRPLLFLSCYFELRVVSGFKQQLTEHVIRHSYVMRQNCRQKTKSGGALTHFMLLGDVMHNQLAALIEFSTQGHSLPTRVAA